MGSVRVPSFYAFTIIFKAQSPSAVRLLVWDVRVGVHVSVIDFTFLITPQIQIVLKHLLPQANAANATIKTHSQCNATHSATIKLTHRVHRV